MTSHTSYLESNSVNTYIPKKCSVKNLTWHCSRSCYPNTGLGVCHLYSMISFLSVLQILWVVKTTWQNFFLCKTIGVPIKMVKTQTPTINLKIYGIEIDLELVESRLPSDKVDRIKGNLLQMLPRNHTTLSELKSLICVCSI